MTNLIQDYEPLTFRFIFIPKKYSLETSNLDGGPSINVTNGWVAFIGIEIGGPVQHAVDGVVRSIDKGENLRGKGR